MVLKLNSSVDNHFGIPKFQFKKDAKNIEFCTVKEFIDNPKTIETFRYIMAVREIDFSYEVYDYIDSFRCTKKERRKRKRLRDSGCLEN